MKTADKPFVSVPAAVHTLNILRLLAKADTPVGVTAVARAVGVSPSSCYNLLKTLCAQGVAEFDAEDKSYRLGAGINELVREGRVDPAQALLRPRLAAMAGQYRFASGLWRVSATGRLVLLDFADSELATRIHMNIGQRLPAYIGAMGRCVAAYASGTDEELATAFNSLRWARAPAPERYRKEVSRVRRQGWAVDDGDFMRGICTVAAPVLDERDGVRYCIANTFFQGEHDPEGIAQIGVATAECALEASRTLFPRGVGAARGVRVGR
jgi:DNA-binding IclR family transcriptional regulator